jgi:hypothetical protein
MVLQAGKEEQTYPEEHTESADSVMEITKHLKESAPTSAKTQRIRLMTGRLTC